MTTDTCAAEATNGSNPTPPRPALLEYAAQEAADIGATTTASLNAALQTASTLREELSAVETVVYVIDPPVAYATADGALRQIEQVKVGRFRGNIRFVSSVTMEEVTSPHVELLVRQIDADGQPSRDSFAGGLGWCDLDEQFDHAEIAALFPGAHIDASPAEDGGEIFCGESITSTLETTAVHVHVIHEGLTVEDIQSAVEEALRATRATHVGGMRVRYPEQ